MNTTASHHFIRACFREPVDRTPVWIMRQAGRYLAEYRALRAQHDFSTMYKTPELACEVTLQPVDLIGVDAAILFSDILVIPEAMGMEVRFIEGRGPVFPSPLEHESDIAALVPADPAEALKYVLDAIALTRTSLNDRVPLIGFSGAPWTLITYMIEGQGSKQFRKVRRWRYQRPDLIRRLVDKVAESVTAYCTAQIEAGAEAIQLFDTWAGILDPDGFEQFALAPVNRILERLRGLGVPLIYFPKGGMAWKDRLAGCSADVIGLDWTVDMAQARMDLPERFALQGNLDPAALYGGPDEIRRRVRELLAAYGERTGHIANLGHGIYPDIPPEHARTFVQAVQEESRHFHPPLETSKTGNAP